MNEFLLRTADGVDLSCAVTTGSARPEGAVVIAHGFTATQDDPNVTELRTTLVDAGLDVVTFDARGHGESGGACTLGMDERHDVAAAVDVARTRADKVVVVGASMGAIAALGHSVDDTGLAGVVTVSSPARWRIHGLPTVGAAVMTKTRAGRRFLASKGRVRVAPRIKLGPEPRSLASRLRVPLAVIHGAADRFMPVKEADELFRCAGARRRIDVLPGMGHAFHPLASARILDAVSWALASA
jgi:alpha-beta hydrolase superfamily lysophospholipase